MAHNQSARDQITENQNQYQYKIIYMPGIPSHQPFTSSPEIMYGAMPGSTHTMSSRSVLPSAYKRDLTPCPLEVSHFRVQSPSSASRADHLTYGRGVRSDHLTYGGGARADHLTYGAARSDYMRDSTLVSHLTPKSSHPFLHLKTSAEVYAKAYELHQKGSSVFVDNICEKCYKENRVRCSHGK